MGIWARLVEMVAVHLALPADRKESAEERNARDIRGLEAVLARAKKHASVAAACERLLAREVRRQSDRVALWQRRARRAESAQLSNRQKEHEELLADLQAHHTAAQRDYRDAAATLSAIETRLIESRLVQQVLQQRNAKREV
jgi:hypothetical protein